MKQVLEPLVVIDVPNLFHRMWHSYKPLGIGDTQACETRFRFTQAVERMRIRFGTNTICFCFDGKNLIRRNLYPGYKQRPSCSPEQKEARFQLNKDLGAFRERIREAGNPNVFLYEGLESDDLLAQLALTWSSQTQVILVTTDQDLYQCLSPNVVIYHPRTRQLFTENRFRREYGINPVDWVSVKSLAGCLSDTVPGISGVGNITALRYLRGELSPRSLAYEKITRPPGPAIARRNLRLVALPIKGCPTPEITWGVWNSAKWRHIGNRG